MTNRATLRAALSAACLALLAHAACAQHAPAECPATPAAPPPELAGWTGAITVEAGGEAAGAPALPVGTGVAARLRPTPSGRYPLRPEKPGGSVSHGGLFTLAVETAGRYRVALGTGAWIDLVSEGAAQRSVAHGHGPACTGIRKMVDFELAPGRHLLQIAGNGTPDLRLLVAKLPR